MDRGDHYSPSEAAKILSRSGQRIGERRVRKMCADGEIAGAEQREGGRWKIPAATVHALLEDRRSRRERQDRLEAPDTPLGSKESAAEMLDRLLDAERRAARLEGMLELEERAASTVREQLDRERDRADRLEAELRETRDRLEERSRPWWRRIFSGG